MTSKYAGGCQCGAVRYDSAADPVLRFNCHCRNCQRASGSAFLSGFAVPANAVNVTGEVNQYGTVGDEDRRSHRVFCPSCGTTVLGRPQGIDLVVINTATLDDPGWFRPQFDIYTASALPWVFMDPDLPKFDALPPLELP